MMLMTWYAELCDEHHVRGYPQINLYRDGEYVEEYGKPRDLPLLLEYTSLHADKQKGSKEHQQQVLAIMTNAPLRVEDAPVELLVLDKNDFHQMTSQGAWSVPILSTLVIRQYADVILAGFT
jgi:thioredoxin domain-containing protein 5